MDPSSQPELLDNSPPPAVDRRELDPDPIAHEHPDEIAVDPVGDVRRHETSAFQLHAVQRARQNLCDDAGDSTPG